jgi:hypothetical protein
MKENEFDLDYSFGKVVKDVRDKIDIILLKIERSRDLSSEALKGMLKQWSESMVRAVEKVMNGMSDEIARARKERYREEKEIGLLTAGREGSKG